MAKFDFDPKDISFPLFIEMYAKTRERKIPWHQFRMAEWLEETHTDQYRLLQAYRESGKSDITSLYIPWVLMRDPDWTFLIVSATSRIASRNARFIRDVISNFYLTEHLKPEDYKNQQWLVNSFTVIRKFEDLNPSVTVTSLDGTSTGIHAKTFIGDDVEVEENVQTEDAREYLWTRCGSFSALCNKQLWVGTPHDEDTIYGKLVALPFDYKTLKIPADDGVGEHIGTPVNPDVIINGFKQDKEWIEGKRDAKSWGHFQSQYRLIPAKAYETLFKLDLINIYGDKNDKLSGITIQENMDTILGFGVDYNYFVEGEELRDITAYWDPATARKQRDDSALAIVASTVKGDIYVVHLDALSAVSIDEGFGIQCEEVVTALKAFGLTRVHVERNFSEELSSTLRNKAKEMGYKLKVVSEFRGAQGKAKSFAGQNKFKFIADQIDPAIRTNHFYVHTNIWAQSKLRGQLADFPKGKKDDLIDAIAGAMEVLKRPKLKSGLNAPDRPFSGKSKIISIGDWSPF